MRGNDSHHLIGITSIVKAAVFFCGVIHVYIIWSGTINYKHHVPVLAYGSAALSVAMCACYAHVCPLSGFVCASVSGPSLTAVSASSADCLSVFVLGAFDNNAYALDGEEVADDGKHRTASANVFVFH